jgi:hypothetical protein
MMLFNPGQQRARIVKTHMYVRMSFQHFDKRQVAARVGLLEDIIEIANGLVRVNEENQMELRRHGN